MSILDQTFLQLSANLFLAQIIIIAWLLTERTTDRLREKQ